MTCVGYAITTNELKGGRGVDSHPLLYEVAECYSNVDKSNKHVLLATGICTPGHSLVVVNSTDGHVPLVPEAFFGCVNIDIAALKHNPNTE